MFEFYTHLPGLVPSNASLNLTVGGRSYFAYIKVAVSRGKLLRWAFRVKTSAVLFEAFD